jgi:hypothetical protein
MIIGEHVYFMHKDQIHFGEISRKFTEEDEKGKDVWYEMKGITGSAIPDEEVFETKTALIDFLMRNVQNEPKS